MSITFKKFEPRPGIVNKQGCLPDPTELVCIEVPKVFDQCLIKKCLEYHPDPDTDSTDAELRSNPLVNPKRFLGCRDFSIKLLAVDRTPIPNKPGFNKITISFMICFYADYIDDMGNTKSELYEINRTEKISKMYCPDTIAQIASTSMPCTPSDGNIIKLEMVAECLNGVLGKDEKCNDVLDVTLGFHLIVKCELIVQLLIPAYDYCPVPKPCEEEPIEDACEKFSKQPPPKFYPDQNMDPLFPDYDCFEDEN